MTKQQIRVVLPDSDWIEKLEGCTSSEALCYINSVPSNITFDTDYCGYGCSYMYGELSYMREETDEEYSARLAKEAQSQREREARMRLEQENQAEKMARYALQEVALHAYLKQHEGNPQSGDLENLFRMVQNLEAAGSAASSVAALKECMAGIEKNT